MNIKKKNSESSLVDDIAKKLEEKLQRSALNAAITREYRGKALYLNLIFHRNTGLRYGIIFDGEEKIPIEDIIKDAIEEVIRR